MGEGAGGNNLWAEKCRIREQSTTHTAGQRKTRASMNRALQTAAVQQPSSTATQNPTFAFAHLQSMEKKSVPSAARQRPLPHASFE